MALQLPPEMADQLAHRVAAPADAATPRASRRRPDAGQDEVDAGEELLAVVVLA